MIASEEFSTKEKDSLIVAVLEHVPFDGWSDTALVAAANQTDFGVNSARRLFSRGGPSMIEYYSSWADRGMVDSVMAHSIQDLGIRRKVGHIVRTRFEGNEKYREAIRRALACLALPQNTLLSIKCLYKTVDSVWFLVGDKSTDFNFYTKRALLAGVYSATLLYWLEDESNGQNDTWNFLNRRLDDVIRFGSLRKNIQGIIPDHNSTFSMFGRFFKSPY